MSKPTGSGRTEHRTKPKSLLLYNFDIDGDRLKAEHEAFLRKEVVPVLKRGGSVSLVGLASRTGSASYNKGLSERRANNTLAFLRKEVPSGFAARSVTGVGESKAEQEGYRDGSEDARFRSVVVLTSSSPTPPVPPKKTDVTPEKPKELAGPKDRTLVVLLENGGITLDVTAILMKLKKLIPASYLIPDSVIKKAGDYIKEQIKKATDSILESADLLLNRFNKAVPGKYGKVIILRDGSASYTDLKNTLIDQTRANKTIDLFILTHGGHNSISVRGGITSAKIQDIKTANGNNPLNLRVVYMMNCVGSSLNNAWLSIGAKASSGTVKNNYLPEPSMYLFWTNWKNGQSFENAVKNAYKTTINIMDGIIKSIPLGGYLIGKIDVKNLDFVKDSQPVVRGQGSLTINSPR